MFNSSIYYNNKILIQYKMRSYLEIESMNARHIMEVRSDYQRTNQYSETHPDALAPDYSGGQGRVHTMQDGTTYTAGKGTGHGGHSHYLPHASGTIGVFNYSNYDTEQHLYRYWDDYTYTLEILYFVQNYKRRWYTFSLISYLIQ